MGARDGEPGEGEGPLPPLSSCLIFYLVTCVSESCSKSLFEWSGEKKERKKDQKKEKVGPHIPSDPSLMGETRCLLGTQTETQTQRDMVSPVEPLRLWTSGLGGGERPEGLEPRAGGSPGRILGGGEHWNGGYVVISKMLFHLFFLASDLGSTLGSGGSGAGSVTVGYGFGEGSRTLPTDRAFEGLSLHRAAS